MFWILNGYTNQRRFTQWTLNVKTVQLRLLPVQFTFPTLRFDSPRSLFDYLPEPMKEDSFPSRESQPRQPPLPMRFPPGFKALRRRSLPHPDPRRYEATLQIPKTTFLPMRALLDPFFLRRSSPSRYDQVDQRLPMTMKTVAKGILKDHLVLVADSMMNTGINNAGYKATFCPLKGCKYLLQSPPCLPL
jgi:hypothetical protein